MKEAPGYTGLTAAAQKKPYEALSMRLEKTRRDTQRFLPDGRAGKPKRGGSPRGGHPQDKIKPASKGVRNPRWMPAFYVFFA